MNLPNKLTVLRVLLVPVFVFLLMCDFIPHRYLLAFIVFAAASYTDHLDGKIARRDRLVTTFGKFMDPLADKILVMAALICFAVLGHVDVGMVLLIMFREFAVTSVRLVAADGGKVIAANNLGKLKTVTQIVAILVILLLQYLLTLELPFPGDMALPFFIAGEAFMAVATIFTLFSGYVYVRDNWDAIKQMK